MAHSTAESSCFRAMVALLSLTSPSQACTCRSVPIQVYFRHSAAVFSATVLGTKESHEKGYFGILATLRVQDAWKGVRPGQLVTIATGHGGGDCGVEFKRDSVYLVFARPAAKKGWLTTSIG